jgi:hypothetical protein
MSNGFPIIAGEQNTATQTTTLFNEGGTSGTPTLYVGLPINEWTGPQANQAMEGIIARGFAGGVGVVGWGGGEGATGVFGLGGVQGEPYGTAGGIGVEGQGGQGDAPGVVGFGGTGTAGYSTPAGAAPAQTVSPVTGGVGVEAYGGPGSTTYPSGIDPGSGEPANGGVGIVGVGGWVPPNGGLPGSGVVGYSADTNAISPFDETLGIGVAGGGQIGVYGYSVDGQGVFGLTSAPQAAVFGINVNDSGAGAATGVHGYGPVGGLGVVGQVPAVSTVDSGGAAIFGNVTGSPPTGSVGPFAGLFNGPVHVNGSVGITEALTVADLTVTGTNKSVAVPFPDGSHRRLYCMESPECWFEDFGEGKLRKGKAQIKLPRDFAAVIKTDSYHVFLTPYGRSNGLYVSKRTRQGFHVEEQGSGKSNVSFSFRIVGARKDVKAERFAKISLPKIPKLPELPPLKHTDHRQTRPRRRTPTVRPRQGGVVCRVAQRVECAA